MILSPPAAHAVPLLPTWFVTGSSTGFGRCLVEHLLTCPAQVVATARDVGNLAELGERDPARLLTLPLDVTDGRAVQPAVDAAMERFGRIDVLVNNAGYAQRGAAEEVGDEDLRRQFEVNVFGAMSLTRAVLPIMRRQRHGTVVQMSSVAGVRAMLGGGAYAASKFALEALSEAMASELAPFGVRVIIVQPGPFRTDFARSARWSSRIEDYAPVIEPARLAFESMHGSQPGDPLRAAQIIAETVRLTRPPQRLPLGPEAFDLIRARLVERVKEVDEVEVLGRGTSFAGRGV